MHTELPLLLTLTGGLATALVLGYITQRFGLSPIVGYLLAGVVIGPSTPGFTADRGLAEQLAEVGIILLMFGVGLSFHFRELLAVRRIAVPGALVQITVATALGALLGRALGWELAPSIVFGLCVSVASTVVLVRVLADNNHLHTPTGHVAVGWLVVEDIFTVLVLVVLPAFYGTAAVSGTALPLTLGLTALKLGMLLALAAIVGRRAIPWLLGQVARTGSRELFTLTVLVLALGIAVLSAQLFGVSMALGAFLAGMVVGRSDFSLRAATEALPMRDAFAVLFFVSVGMLFDWRALVATPGLVLWTLAIILVGKPLAALLITLALGYPLRIALAVAVVLAQVGEFSFILAALAGTLGLMPPGANDALIAAAIISISINPLLYKSVAPAGTWLGRQQLIARWLARRAEAASSPLGRVAGPAPLEFGAVVVGYGPIGQTLVRLLQENDIVPSIIEMNLDTVRQLQREGLRAVYGDASQAETLKQAGIERAGALFLTPQLQNVQEVLRVARELNPKLNILARATYLRDHLPLISAGADAVHSDEGEVALAMVESALRALGATPDQLDRERERLNRDLLP